jgi:hypothetical protein
MGPKKYEKGFYFYGKCLGRQNQAGLEEVCSLGAKIDIRIGF